MQLSVFIINSTKMNKALIAIIVIIILVGGFFLFFGKSSAPLVNNNPSLNNISVDTKVQGKTDTTTVNPNTAKKVTVNYTDSGFSPQTITIKRVTRLFSLIRALAICGSPQTPTPYILIIRLLMKKPP